MTRSERVIFAWFYFCQGKFLYMLRKYSGTPSVSDQFPIHLLYFMWGCAFITGANLLIISLEKRGTWYVFFQITAKLTNLTIYVLMTPPPLKIQLLEYLGSFIWELSTQIFLNCSALKFLNYFQEKQFLQINIKEAKSWTNIISSEH